MYTICFNPSKESTAVLTNVETGQWVWVIGFNPSKESTAVLTTRNVGLSCFNARFNPSKESTAVLTAYMVWPLTLFVVFQPLKGINGRSDV